MNNNDIFILANPSSGQNKAEEAANYLQKLYKEQEVIAEIHLTENEEDIFQFTEKASTNNYASLVIIGGDGTVSLVINALKTFAYKPKLGIIPTGTVNNVANSLGIADNVFVACEQVINGEPSKADVGQINDKLFISTVSSGDIPEQALEVSSEDKEKYGTLAYIFEGIQSLVEETTHKFQITVDGKEENLDLDLLIVGVSSSVMGLTDFFKDATYNDGNLYMFGLKSSNIGEKISEFSRLLTTDEMHKNDEENISFILPFKEAKINLLNSKANTAVDGEVGAEFPIHLKILHKFITFIIPTE